jgi:hypothetical protein
MELKTRLCRADLVIRIYRGYHPIFLSLSLSLHFQISRDCNIARTHAKFRDARAADQRRPEIAIKGRLA